MGGNYTGGIGHSDYWWGTPGHWSFWQAKAELVGEDVKIAALTDDDIARIRERSLELARAGL